MSNRTWDLSPTPPPRSKVVYHWIPCRSLYVGPKGSWRKSGTNGKARRLFDSSCNSTTVMISNIPNNFRWGCYFLNQQANTLRSKIMYHRIPCRSLYVGPTGSWWKSGTKMWLVLLWAKVLVAHGIDHLKYTGQGGNSRRKEKHDQKLGRGNLQS